MTTLKTLLKFLVRALLAGALLIFLSVGALADVGDLPNTQPPDNSSLPMVETWRIRIQNFTEGPIEVSTDRGQTWTLIGRVSVPATESLMGYLAAGYAPIGTVAATAVHGIRIRLGEMSSSYPSMINIVPKEFAVTPNYFGGHIAGSSGIYTNIPSGVSLFRELAPYVGSPTYLVKNKEMYPLTSSYVPQVGDTLMIVSKRRANELKSIVFENRSGGAVTATYADGTSQVVTHVVKPVLGVGRFDGTSYTGVGAVNTNHTCVITVGTAPVSDSKQMEGDGEERRGGFQIEPYYHNTQTEEEGAPQVMVIGQDHAQLPTLEGRAPLFYGGITLAWSPGDPAHSWVCDIQTASTGDKWLPMPQMVGNQANAIAQRGITAFRLHRDIGDSDLIWLRKDIAEVGKAYQSSRALYASSGGLPLIHGNYFCPSGAGDIDPSTVEFYVDGNFAAVTDSVPYAFTFDSRHVADGEHLIEARAEDSAGNVLKTTHRLVYVDNSQMVKGSG